MNFAELSWWDKFTLKKFPGEVKPRWLIYLGDTGNFHEPKISFLCTTTTTLHLNKLNPPPMGMSFSIIDYPIFKQDCYLYFDEDIYQVYDYEIEKNKKDIIFMGNLDAKTMKEIYFGYWATKKQSPKILNIIRDSYNKNGIDVPAAKKV